MKTSSCIILTIILIFSFSLPLIAQDNAQIGLPDGAIGRLGKGTLGQIHFSPDGSKLAVATSVGIWIHDPKTGKELDLIPHPYMIYPFIFAFSPDGSKIAIGRWQPKDPMFSGRNKYTIEVLDLNTRKEIMILRGHVSRINSIVFSPDGKYILSAALSKNKLVKLWSVETGKEIFTPRKHTKWVSSIAYAPDGNTFATVGDGNAMNLWNGKTGEHKYTLTAPTERVRKLTYTSDSLYLATDSIEGKIHLWDVATGIQTKALPTDAQSLKFIRNPPNGNMIAISTENGDVQLWHPQTMKQVSTFAEYAGTVKSIAYSHDGSITVATSSDGTVRLWDAATGKTNAILTGYMKINAATYSPDSKTIVTGHQDGTLHIWDVFNAKHKRSFQGDMNGIILDIAYSPNSNNIAVVSTYNDRVLLLDASTGKHKRTLNHYNIIDEISQIIWDKECIVSSIAYSPDGKTIATGLDCYTHEESRIYLWHAEKGKRKRVLYKGPGSVQRVWFSADGKRLIATGHWKDDLRVWNAETGKKLTPIPADQPDNTSDFVYSPDGTTASLLGQNGSVIIWDKIPTDQDQFMKINR